MNVPTITMDRDAAVEALEKYREAVEKKESTAEDRAIMLGYQALASGKSLIDIHDAFRFTGLDEQGRPKLAICRADYQRVRCNTNWRGTTFFRAFRGGLSTRASTVTIPAGVLPRFANAPQGEALLPLIPLSVRPKNLSGYRILWEADWADAPVDPFLLKKLSGTLHIILAVWDLTPLERSVLRGRLQERM